MAGAAKELFTSGAMGLAGYLVGVQEEKKKMAKEASDKQDQQFAAQMQEREEQKKTAAAQEKQTRQRAAAISNQKAQQGSGRDATILGGASGLPDMSAVTDTLGGTNTGGKTLLGM